MRSTNALYKCTKALAASYCNPIAATATVSRTHQSNKVHKSITGSLLGTTTIVRATGLTTRHSNYYSGYQAHYF